MQVEKTEKLRDSVRKTCSRENVKDMHEQYFAAVLEGSKNQKYSITNRAL